MIKMVGEIHSRPVLLLGLSGENMTRLMADEPMMFDGTRCGYRGLVVLVGGRTEDHILGQIAHHGLAARLGLQPVTDPELTAAQVAEAQLCEAVARAIEAEADDEAQRPTRDAVSHAVETTFREAATIARGADRTRGAGTDPEAGPRQMLVLGDCGCWWIEHQPPGMRLTSPRVCSRCRPGQRYPASPQGMALVPVRYVARWTEVTR